MNTPMLKSLTILKSFFLITALLVSVSMSSQCDGSVNGGALNVLTTMSSPMTSSISTEDFSFVMAASPGAINITSSSGLKFFVDPSNPGQVKNVSMGDDISNLASYVSGPLLVYNNATFSGPFGGGKSGFIGVEKDGRIGWVELGSCGSKTCNPNAFEYPILDRCLNGVSGGTVLAGVKSGLVAPSDIPTMSEWAVMILLLIMVIIGVIAIRQPLMQTKREI